MPGYRIIPAAVLFLFICLTHTASAQDKPHVSIRAIENDGFYNNINEPAVIADSAAMYDHADTSAKPIGYLPRGKRLDMKEEATQGWAIEWDTVIEGHTVHNKKYMTKKWYVCEMGQSKVYVDAGNVATHTFGGSYDTIRYYVVTDFSKTYNPDYDGFRVYAYNSALKKFTDTLSIDHFFVSTVHYLPYVRLRKTDMLIVINQIEAFCGGTQGEVYVAGTKGKLALLSKGYSWADDGSADGESMMVWLPVTLGNGKVLLAAGGDVAHIFNDYDGTLNITTVPQDITVPKKDLVVVTDSKSTTVLDKDGNPVMLGEDEYKYTTKTTTHYYRWTGTGLVKVK